MQRKINACHKSYGCSCGGDAKYCLYAEGSEPLSKLCIYAMYRENENITYCTNETARYFAEDRPIK